MREEKPRLRFLIIFTIIIAAGIIIPLGLYFFIFQDGPGDGEQPKIVGGILTQNEIWSGNILVTSNVKVPQGITLEIELGTIIKFKHYRGYREFSWLTLYIDGGTILAIGAPDAQIWFTSDGDPPMNGDWAGIILENTNKSIFEYVIVEFAQIGIEQFDSAVNVSRSIIRYSNTEGLYAERSKPHFIDNTLYSNAYHDIALEQYNYNVTILNNIFKGGHFGVHTEASEVYCEGNYFVNYSSLAITAGQYSNISIIANRFENIGQNPPFNFDVSVNNITGGNDFGTGFVPIPVFDYQDVKGHELSYIPGDPEDEYLYVYDSIDETREVLNRIGISFGFGWSLTYVNNSLWRFEFANEGVGDFSNFVRINITTRENVTYGNNWIVNPRGLTYDGEYFWVNDFSLLKIFKFRINSSNYINIIYSFDIPDKFLGGTMGLTNNGTHLFQTSRNGTEINIINKTGILEGKIKIKSKIWAGGAICWDGQYFWAAGGTVIAKLAKNGTLVGLIYPPAIETIALEWDGAYLWSIQKTCELWIDDKIFKMEILNATYLLDYLSVLI